jgi:hypothetical protein
MVLPFFSPLRLDFWTAGPEEAKEPGGAKGLRLIQIRLTTSSLEKICRLGKTKTMQVATPVAASLCEASGLAHRSLATAKAVS